MNQSTGGAQIPWSASKLTAPYFVFERAADAPPPPAEAALADAAKRPIRSFSAEEAYAAAVERDTLAGYEEFLAAYPNGVEAKRVRAILAARREALFWRRAVAQDTRAPTGPICADIRAGPMSPTRTAARHSRRGGEPPADFAPEDYADLPPPPPDELVYADQPVFVFVGPDFGPPPPPPPSASSPRKATTGAICRRRRRRPRSACCPPWRWPFR